jgi:probable HAF family extracellular repeat protein
VDHGVACSKDSLRALALAALATLGAGTAPAQAAPPAASTPRYSVVELTGVPTRINDKGHVSGWINVGGAAHAALYSNGVWRDMGVLPGDQLSVLYDVNNAGAAVGFSFASLQPPIPPDTFADNRWQAVRAAPGSTALAALSVIAPDSFAYAINDAGVVVGCLNRYDDVFPDPHRAYVYANGALTDIHALLSSGGGFDFTCARDVNASGQVVGEVQLQNSPSRGFLFRDGTVTLLVQGAAHLSNARAINDAGRIVGEGRLAGFTADHAVAYDVASGSVQSLGLEATGAFSSRPNDVNANGVVVGTMTLNVGERAFMVSGGQVHDLNDLIPADSGWVLEEAFAVNANGQIVGRGRRASAPGETRYFLLDVVLDPLSSIGSLIQQVKALQKAGFLSKGNAALMIAELTVAECKLRARKSRLAVLSLEIFVKHVDLLIRAGRLAPSKGQPLIDQADRIIDAILGR